jgi:hypothetical protein
LTVLVELGLHRIPAQAIIWLPKAMCSLDTGTKKRRACGTSLRRSPESGAQRYSSTKCRGHTNQSQAPSGNGTQRYGREDKRWWQSRPSLFRYLR